MTFKFSLQKILDLREKEVEQAQLLVNSTKNSILQLKMILEKERVQYFSDRDELNAAVKKVEFTEIKIYEKSLSIRQSKMMETLKNIRDMQRDLSEFERILMETKLSQKSIEKLFEKKYKEYEKVQEMKEQQSLDELATLNFFKNQFEDENEE